MAVDGERDRSVADQVLDLPAVLGVAAALARRREIIGIVDWLRSEIERLGVDLRCNVFAEACDVLEEGPDVVVIATGGVPDTSFLAEGEELAVTCWHILGRQAAPGLDVLLFDANGAHPGASCAEFLARAGNQLAAVLYDEYARALDERVVDQVVIEHGTLPADALYFELKPGSSKLGEIDLDALLAGEPQNKINNPDGAYRLFRVGDAVASRNIHAAIYDSLRLSKDF